MKKIFTLAVITAVALMTAQNANSQNCNYSNGRNGWSTSTPAAVVIDGNMADWAPFLADPDNNSYDNTDGIDLDGPISDNGRDLVRFAFTENANNLFIYLERAGSSNNSVDIIFYVDVNNNDVMEYREPVYHINWSGSNGNVTVSVRDYHPNLLDQLLNLISLNLDGKKMMGTMNYRSNQGPGVMSGQGAADGSSVEIKIPFSNITKLNGAGNVTHQLAFGQDFKFHVSTINGNISSVPGLNSVNDNFGGCLTAPTSILPVKLASFTATLNNNKADLKWTTASEINVSHFVVEKSTDGINFTDAGMIFSYGSATDKTNYSFSDNLANTTATVVYYRLRSVDIDGKTQYSETRVIRISKGNETNLTILTFPNPATNELKVTIPSTWQNKQVRYEIFSANGQVVSRIQANSSSQTETINISKLAPGFYLVKAICGTESAQQRVVKQ